MALKIGIFQILADARGDPAIVARAAEDLGFNSYWVPEHAILPVRFDSAYAADSGDGSPPPDYLAKMPDPWIALTRAASNTQSIRLGSGICLVPEHNPLILANTIASLDHYCGGRVNFGIGAGWNREEAEILGVDFDHRWTQTRECVEVIRKLWTTEAAEHHGRYFDFPAVRCEPKPAQEPCPPVLLGSAATQRVFERVVDWGDGWIPILRSPADLEAGCRRLEQLCAERGRDRAELHVAPFGGPGQCRTAAERDAIAAAGADELIVWLNGEELDSMLDDLKSIADTLLT